MEQWTTAGEERPYIRNEGSKPYPWIIGLLLVLLAASVGYYYYYTHVLAPQALPAPAAAPERAAPAPQAETPPVRLPAPEAAAKPLPTLENSDSMMRDSIAGL